MITPPLIWAMVAIFTLLALGVAQEVWADRRARRDALRLLEKKKPAARARDFGGTL